MRKYQLRLGGTYKPNRVSVRSQTTHLPMRKSLILGRLNSTDHGEKFWTRTRSKYTDLG